jgi:gas vesicle protein
MRRSRRITKTILQEVTMRNLLMFMMGTLSGAVVGVALALLLTPASGEELRSQVSGRYHSVQDEVRAAAQTRRAELERQLQQLRAPRLAE